MKKYFPKLFQQVLALLLCTAMLLPMAVQPVTAAEDIYYSSDTDITESEDLEWDGDYQEDEPIHGEPVPSEPGPELILPVEGIPDCSCGNAGQPVTSHSDSDCAMKKYYMTVCGGTAEEICSLWFRYEEDAQEYVLQYLSWTDREKYSKLVDEINSIPYTDNTQSLEDGTGVSLSGIPKMSTVTVKQASDAAKQAVADYVQAQGDDSAQQLFMWDISIQDAMGNEWQPEAGVWVELEIPGLVLHQYATIHIVHVDDNGVASTISGEVTEDGKIAFEARGFSTFAGFTVDFAYGDAYYSLNGLESILLSELFETMQMPLYISDVVGVEFSDPELISVTKQDNGDWKLISLKAFNTTETLTVTMTDGKVYEITVTDADPTIKIGNKEYDSDNNNIVTWRANSNGKLSQYDGWSESEQVLISGGGTFRIELQAEKTSDNKYVTGPSDDPKYLFINMHQVQITGNTNVIVEVMNQFDASTEYVYLRPVSKKTQTLFHVKSGSLTFIGKENRKLVISGRNADPNNNGYYWENPLINLDEGCTSFKASHCDFRQSGNRAIYISTNQLDTFELTDCLFRNTIRAQDGSKEKGYGRGGAIYLEAMNGTTWNDIDAFTLTNCTFSENTAATYGGAVALYGRVNVINVTGCIFDKCKALANNGGAFFTAGRIGTATFTNTTFSGCEAENHGGAVCFQSIKNDNGNYQRVNDVTFDTCTFTNCTAWQNHGGAISVAAQTNSVTIKGCEFKTCKAKANGGAVSLYNINMGTNKDWPDGPGFSSWENVPGTENTSYYAWPYTDENDEAVTHRYYTMINKVLIDQNSAGKKTTFTGCISNKSGGAIEFASNSYVKDADIKNTTIDGCKAVSNGSAIFTASTVVKSLHLENLTVQNCDFIKSTFTTAADGTKTYTTDANGFYVDAPGNAAAEYINDSEAGGTIRSTGNTTCALTMTNCTVQNNKSKNHGGGLYWNANNERDVLERCTAVVTNCTFSGNFAILDGGGIYCESTLTVSNCQVFGNEARNGGGIAQQVYSNASRMMKDGEQTNLTLNSGTVVYNNYANQNGGGISIRANPTQSIQASNAGVKHSVIFNLEGSTVRNNTAKMDGGGIFFIAIRDNSGYYDTDANGNEIKIDDAKSIEINNAEVDSYTKSITITDGQVYENTAGVEKATGTVNGGNGGGIYVESSEDTTLSISSGHIYSNTAVKGDGGGIYMSGKNATCTITGGTIGGGTYTVNDDGTATIHTSTPNKATRQDNTGGHGGGIAITGGARIEMSGGEISCNQAIHYNGTGTGYCQGGGIWLDAKKDGVANSMNLSGGVVLLNSTAGGTDGDGGGIYVGSESEFEILNGEIKYNSAGTAWGGGIFSMRAQIIIRGGVIAYNRASCGGGVGTQWAGAHIQIYNGEIAHNTATSDGGGIYCNDGILDIYGGSIYQNTAGNAGGGICGTGASAKITMSGGKISENTGTNYGGGIYLSNDAEATISGTEATDTRAATYGEITENTSARGGGICVVVGAKLTVNNGYITHNTATGKPAGKTTAYREHDSLSGTGGGVYVANGVSDDNPAQFVLTGQTIAIYGNLADFAADDVFSNGVYTKLSIPTVDQMDLAGYGLIPDGWVEDYPENDTAYESGLNGGVSAGIINSKVWRYRGSPIDKRVLVDVDNNGSLLANAANEYVCMTLGGAAALPDTIVVDFGLPVWIDILGNDLIIGAGNAGDIYVGTARPGSANNSVDKTDEIISGFAASKDFAFGTATVSEKQLQYTLTDMISTTEVFSYAVQYNGVYYYANVTVIPATSIYYEDGFVTYSTYTFSDGDETGTTAANGWIAVGTEADKFQAEDRPGIGNLYGYDPAYGNMTTHSLNSAMKFTAKAESGVNTYGTAEFTFYGTGFDVISVTSSDTGFIVVQVYAVDENGNETLTETTMVDTYYGYKRELHKITYTYNGVKWKITGEETVTMAGISETEPENPTEGSSYTIYKYVWIPDATDNALYQVPVIKIKGLNYGKYKAVITVSYNELLDHKDPSENGAYDFYLDAIRIYDPANDGKGNQVIKDAYVADGEGWPEYFELRNIVISKNQFDSLTDDSIPGVVFIDNTADNTASAEDYVPGISDYNNYGPNNELYLAPGQAVTFKLNVPGNVAAIHIGLKTVGGGIAQVTVQDAAAALVYEELGTTADLYYDITDLNNKNVLISNGSEQGGAIVSITNIKVTYGEEHVDSSDAAPAAYFSANREIASLALQALSRTANDRSPVTADVFQPTLYLFVMLGAVACLAVLLICRKKVIR